MRLLVSAVALALGVCSAQAAPFTMDQVLSYPYASDVVAAPSGGHVAWVRNVAGVRNVWVADAPSYRPRQVTKYTDDDGQEIGELAFSPDAKYLVYVRGGDHDSNWEADSAPVPDATTEQAKVTIWSVALPGGVSAKVGEGDEPALASGGRIAFVLKDQVWEATLGRATKPVLMFYDRGKDHELHWSPDGKRLAFRSNRGDHSFIGIFDGKTKPLTFLAPTTNLGLVAALVARRRQDRLRASAGTRRRAGPDPEADAQSVVDLGRRRRDGRGACGMEESRDAARLVPGDRGQRESVLGGGRTARLPRRSRQLAASLFGVRERRRCRCC